MPRFADHAQRRREIAYAVWYVIATQGFDAVTMRAVAAEADISVGRIQHYFASKDEMVRAACLEMITLAADRYAARVGDRPAVEALEVLILSTIPENDDARIGTAVWYAFLARSIAEPEIATIMRDAQAGLESEVVRLLVAAAENGDLVPTSADPTTARRLIALSDGLTQRVLIGALSADSAIEVLRAEVGRLARLDEG
ncbi:MAG TPA: TetR/AcrR family transcriptional regulator [Propionibacteriaceae bacterium]